MSNSNATPAQTAESIYQMLKERTLSQEAFGVDIDYVFTPSDRLETPLPLYVRRQADFEEASDEDIAQARIWFYRDNRVLLNIPYSPEGEESPKRSEYLLRVLGAAIAFIVPPRVITTAGTLLIPQQLLHVGVESGYAFTLRGKCRKSRRNYFLDDGRYCRRHQSAQVPDRVHPGSSLHDFKFPIRSGQWEHSKALTPDHGNTRTPKTHSSALETQSMPSAYPPSHHRRNSIRMDPKYYLYLRPAY